MDKDIKEIDRLLSEGKKDEAKAILQRIVSAPLPEIDNADKGKLLFSLIASYIEMSNRISEAYKEELEEMLGVLKKIKKLEAEMGDKEKLEAVKESLNM